MLLDIYDSIPHINILYLQKALLHILFILIYIYHVATSTSYTNIFFLPGKKHTFKAKLMVTYFILIITFYLNYYTTH